MFSHSTHTIHALPYPTSTRSPTLPPFSSKCKTARAMPSVFSLCQFSVLVIALFCSVHIHGLIRADKEEYAMWVDKIVRVVIPFVLYPVICISMRISGFIQACA